MKTQRSLFMKIICTILILSACFSGAVYAERTHFNERLFDAKSLCEYANISDIPTINGNSAYVYNVETGTVIYRKNQDAAVYPASTVKLMTAIVAYENIPDLDILITASKSAVNAAKGSNMAIKTGEQFTARQLLTGLLVVGANDAANVLAEHVAGSIDSFCDMMNQKAIQIGALSTYYANPTGLHAENMKTTARDTAIIAGYFYGINELFEMSDTKRYTIEKTPLTDVQRILLNRNLLISRVRSEDYYYPNAKGMSLGSTPEAGDCIVTSATDRTGMTYICVVMNAHSNNDKNYACLDAIELLKMCLERFSKVSVVSDKNIICEIPVKLASDTDYVTLRAASGLDVLLPSDFNYEMDISIEPRISKDYATAPIYEGEKYGEAVVKYKDDIILGAIELVASKSVDKSNLLYFLDSLEKLFLGKWFIAFVIISIILFIVYFYLSVYFVSKRRRRR